MCGKKSTDLNNAPGKGLAKFALIRLLQNFSELSYDIIYMILYITCVGQAEASPG